MAIILSSHLKVPWSYTLHSSNILNPYFKRSILFKSRSASKCRTISQITANDLSNFIGPTLSKKVVNVHLGVDIKGFKNVKNGPGYTCMQLCPDILACNYIQLSISFANQKMTSKGLAMKKNDPFILVCKCVRIYRVRHKKNTPQQIYL